MSPSYRPVPYSNKPSKPYTASCPWGIYHLCTCGSPANSTTTVLTALNGSSPPRMRSSNNAGILASCPRSSHLCPIAVIWSAIQASPNDGRIWYSHFPGNATKTLISLLASPVQSNSIFHWTLREDFSPLFTLPLPMSKGIS